MRLLRYKVTRRINGIGQGLFCSETVFSSELNKEFTVVYDCGTLKKDDKNIIKNIISSKDFPKEIEYLFISHFHSDHINCIKDLLRHSVVKHIVMPKITPFQVVSAFVESSENYNPNDFQILKKIFRRTPIIEENRNINYIEIDEYQHIENNPENMEKYRKSILDKELCIYLDGNKTYKVQYIPFNLEDSRTRKFINNLCREYPDLYDALINMEVGKVSNMLKKGGLIREISKIYYNTFTRMNETSMPVLSLLKYDKDNIKRSCLYTGDYTTTIDKKDQKLLQYYSPYINEIAIFQSPHHGSAYDNPQELFDAGFLNYVYSYGAENNFGHPSVSKKLLDSKKWNSYHTVVDNAPKTVEAESIIAESLNFRKNLSKSLDETYNQQPFFRTL